MHCFIYCLCFITTTIVAVESIPTFWDSVPVVSQFKTVFLYVIGEEDGAEKTWENFSNMTHLWENVKNIDNSIPGYGHVKSVIVAINGDQEHAKEILRTAQKSTFIIGGFIIGGPVGAVGGAVAADGMSSLIDQKPVGVIEHALHFENKTMSEHIDVVLDLTLVGVGSKGAAKAGSAMKNLKTSIHFDMKKVGSGKKSVRINENLNEEYSVSKVDLESEGST